MDFLVIQDEIVRHILVALEVKLTFGEMGLRDSWGTTSLEAWLLRAEWVPELVKFTRDSIRRVRKLTLAARELDPDWAVPCADLAATYYSEALHGWAQSRQEAIEAGIGYAEMAIKLDPNDPLGYMQLANIIQLRGAHERAIELREKAVRLAPNSFDVWWGFGHVLLWAGYPERAEAALKRASQLSPRPPASRLSGLTHVELVRGEIEAAAATAEKMIAMKPENPDTLAYAAIAFVAAARTGRARELVAQILQVDPTYSVAEWRNGQHDFRDRPTVDHLADLLTKAGLN